MNFAFDCIQAIAGWKMTENILMKLEYVNQNYLDFVKYGSEANFKGLLFEAAISL
jgi:hypothetical protein